jgi:hypothetical protein
MNQPRHPIEDHDLPEWLQRLQEDEAGSQPWPPRRHIIASLAASALLIFAVIGFVAVFGSRL